MKSNIFIRLGILMIGFGVFIGLVFPFFTTFLGVPSSLAYTPRFFVVSILAGFFVGAANIILAKTTVHKRMSLLARKMEHVETLIQSRELDAKIETCNPETCFIDMPSKDAIGEAAQAFNTLVKSLMKTFQKDDAIQKFNDTISAKLELSDLAPKALEAILFHTEANAGAIFIEQQGELSLIADHNLVNAQSLNKQDTVMKVFNHAKSERIEMPQDIEIDAILTSFSPRCILVLPIVHKQVSIGVLLLASSYNFTQEQERDLGFFMTGLSLSLKNAITHSQLQELAANDPLTQVFNRRFGLMRLQEEYSRAIRQNLPFGLLMMDIDHFKKFNDTYGHLLGDRVLVNVANVLKKAIREGDVLMRYGGEEFMIILPGASLKDSEAIAEKVRRLVDDYSIHHQGSTLSVTISVGFTAYPNVLVGDSSEMIDLADKALYRAKENGRNRIESA